MASLSPSEEFESEYDIVEVSSNYDAYNHLYELEHIIVTKLNKQRFDDANQLIKHYLLLLDYLINGQLEFKIYLPKVIFIKHDDRFKKLHIVYMDVKNLGIEVSRKDYENGIDHEDICGICMENFLVDINGKRISDYTTECGHSFHSCCLNSWYKSCAVNGAEKCCPMCKHPIRVTSLDNDTFLKAEKSIISYILSSRQSSERKTNNTEPMPIKQYTDTSIVPPISDTAAVRQPNEEELDALIKELMGDNDNPDDYLRIKEMVLSGAIR